MRSIKLFAAGSVAALTLLASATFIQDLFPAKSGATWFFTGSIGTQKFNPVCKVSSVKKAGGRTVVVMEWSFDGKSMQTETFWVTPQDVRRVTSGPGGSSKIDPPVAIIKYPMAAGKSWTWKGTVTTNGQVIPATAVLKTPRIETITSAAGTFKAYRVDMTLTLKSGGQSMEVPNTYWFAPGKGMVKQSANIMGTRLEATVSKIVGI